MQRNSNSNQHEGIDDLRYPLAHAQSQETHAAIFVPPVCRKHKVFMCWSWYLGPRILVMNPSHDAEVNGPKLTDPEQSQLSERSLTGAQTWSIKMLNKMPKSEGQQRHSKITGEL